MPTPVYNPMSEFLAVTGSRCDFIAVRRVGALRARVCSPTVRGIYETQGNAQAPI